MRSSGLINRASNVQIRSHNKEHLVKDCQGNQKGILHQGGDRSNADRKSRINFISAFSVESISKVKLTNVLKNNIESKVSILGVNFSINFENSSVGGVIARMVFENPIQIEQLSRLSLSDSWLISSIHPAHKKPPSELNYF